MMKKLSYVLLTSTFVSSLTFAAGYPDRNITDIVSWGAGGGTDTINRLIMAEMAPILDVNINVVNLTGGAGGSAAMVDVLSRPADGYTFVGLTESNTAAGVLGGWEQKMSVFDYFIVGGSPEVISVSAKSNIKTIEDLIKQANQGGKLKAGASSAGTIHHLNLMAFMKGTNTSFNFIPYDSSGQSQNGVLTGEISVVIASLAEQSQLIRSGDLRPLAMLTDEPVTFDGHHIISIFDKHPQLKEYLPITQSVGFAMRNEVSKDKKVIVARAFDQAMKSEKIVTYLKDNNYVASGKYGKAANDEMNKLESLFGWTLWDLGSAKVNPQKLGIPKP